MHAFWKKRLFFGIKLYELSVFVALHLLLAVLYGITIYLATGQNQFWGISINYTLKLLLLLPAWWLFFKKLHNIPIQQKIWLHIPVSTGYAVTWLFLFYAIIDLLHLGRLRGSGTWWDIYITLLIYCIQFALFHTYAYWCEILRNQQREQELLQLQHHAAIQLLQSQIQPHFLFNTLNSISAAMSPAEEKSRSMISGLAEVFRFSMNIHDRKFITLEKELDFIQNLLSLEQYRFGDRLQFNMEVEQKLNSILVPPMLLQPLVENAIKHGIAKSIDGGSIYIKVCRQVNGIAFLIRNTGDTLADLKIDHLFEKGIGLKNTMQRLQSLYGEKLRVSYQPEKGFSVEFILPIDT